MDVFYIHRERLLAIQYAAERADHRFGVYLRGLIALAVHDTIHVRTANQFETRFLIDAGFAPENPARDQ